jgi:hypothetical protein
LTYLQGITGRRLDTNEEVPVPDKVAWTFQLSSGGVMKFTSVASADCIQPGYVYMWDKRGRAQHCSSANGHSVGDNSFYNNKRIYIRKVDESS